MESYCASDSSKEEVFLRSFIEKSFLKRIKASQLA